MSCTLFFYSLSSLAVPPSVADDLPTELVTFQRHPITLPCRGSGDPRPAIVWYKDGTRLPIEGKCIELKFYLKLLPYCEIMYAC